MALAWASVASVIPALWLVRQRVPQPPLAQMFALRGVRWPVLVIAALTGLALQLPLSEVSNWVETLAPVSMEQKLAMAKLLTTETWSATLKLAVAVVVAAPICEELLFRGVLLPGLKRAHGTRVALAWSALLFGAAHAGLVTSVVPAALAGLAFGFVSLRTGSIVPAIVMHAAVNAVPVLAARSRLEITGFNTLQEGVYHVPSSWLVPSCALALVGLWWLNRSTRNEHAAGLNNDLGSDS